MRAHLLSGDEAYSQQWNSGNVYSGLMSKAGMCTRHTCRLEQAESSTQIWCSLPFFSTFGYTSAVVL